MYYNKCSLKFFVHFFQKKINRKKKHCYFISKNLERLRPSRTFNFDRKTKKKRTINVAPTCTYRVAMLLSCTHMAVWPRFWPGRSKGDVWTVPHSRARQVWTEPSVRDHVSASSLSSSSSSPHPRLRTVLFICRTAVLLCYYSGRSHVSIMASCFPIPKMKRSENVVSSGV